MRNLKILHNQLNELSLKDFYFLLWKTLFFDELIFIYQCNIKEQEADLIEPVNGIEIKKGDLDDLEQVRRTVKPMPWEFQCHIFDGVKDFFVARNAGGVQHISWIYYHHDRNRLLALGEKEAEIKFCLTMPALRGHGVYPRVILSILEYLHTIGIERVFMCVHRDNNPSIHGIEKAEFKRVGAIRLRKILGIQISRRYDTNRRGK